VPRITYSQIKTLSRTQNTPPVPTRWTGIRRITFSKRC